MSEILGCSEGQLIYHRDLLHQAGYIASQPMEVGIRPQFLTREGQMASRKFSGKPRL